MSGPRSYKFDLSSRENIEKMNIIVGEIMHSHKPIICGNCQHEIIPNYIAPETRLGVCQDCGVLMCYFCFAAHAPRCAVEQAQARQQRMLGGFSRRHR